MSSTSLLLVTHVLIRQGPNGPQIDDQTAAGIARWCEHFDTVTYYGIGKDDADDGGTSVTWVDLDKAVAGGRARLVALPSAYRVGRMVKQYTAVRGILRAEIGRHTHLCFTVGGLVGDWPAVAALESARQKRAFATWIDRVEPSVIRNKLVGAPILKRAVAALALPAMDIFTKHVLSKSKVALLQGMDTFGHYRASCSDPHCTYDTHTHGSDQITLETLAAKQKRVLSGAPLSIVYLGRAAAMKGPDDWLDTIEELVRRGVPLEATWVGDGPDLARMRERVTRSGLANVVALPGFEGDRDTLLRLLRESDVLMFCHKTPESARCLVESLVSGTPIIGYETAYPKGLVERRGGGVFTPDQAASLADAIAALDRDRERLAALMGNAASSGEFYTEASVYAHRAKLMQRAHGSNGE